MVNRNSVDPALVVRLADALASDAERFSVDRVNLCKVVAVLPRFLFIGPCRDEGGREVAVRPSSLLQTQH